MLSKNEELMKLMKQIEDDKPENWGLKKVHAENVDNSNIMEVYAHNLQKALKKLDLKDKIEQAKKDQKDIDVK